jgi:hypothetical protein
LAEVQKNFKVENELLKAERDNLQIKLSGAELELEQAMKRAD